MNAKKTLTFALMDGAFENSRSTTAFRLIEIAASRGYHINVFAYEEHTDAYFFQLNFSVSGKVR